MHRWFRVPQLGIPCETVELLRKTVMLTLARSNSFGKNRCFCVGAVVFLRKMVTLTLMRSFSFEKVDAVGTAKIVRKTVTLTLTRSFSFEKKADAFVLVLPISLGKRLL